MDKTTWGFRFTELMMEVEDPEDFKFAILTIDSTVPIIKNQVEQREGCCLD